MMAILKADPNTRFIVYEDEHVLQYNYKYLVLLTKLDYWTANIAELSKWCEINSCLHEGMTVSIPDQDRMVLFALRWS